MKYECEGQYPVSIEQLSDGSYFIQYGLQMIFPDTYEEAIQELGKCLMHQLSCAGIINPENSPY